ncbi:hypothetical protein [Nocardioides speluncae]|uniref:hypothetical protein n=1 Tax=Nocardioides speluncae TaxID=2670337 RepID=UPI000D69F02C|nr:hypothetical protein [Nocardioides speluncae]
MQVAPRRQWVLAAMTLGAMLLVFPWVVLAISRGVSGLAEVGVAIAGFGSLLLGAVLGPPLGLLWASLRRPPESDALRPRRQHGVAVHVEPADVVVVDLLGRHPLGGRDRLTLRPYDLPADAGRPRHGLLVTARGRSPIDIPAWFEPADLTAYSQRHGFEVAPVTDNPASLPKWHKRGYRNLLQFGGRSARVLSPAWRRFAWLAPLWAAFSIAVIVLAVVLSTEVAVPLALSGAGGLVLLASGIWWVRTETPQPATADA